MGSRYFYPAAFFVGGLAFGLTVALSVAPLLRDGWETTASVASAIATVAATVTALYFGYRALGDSAYRDAERRRISAAVIFQPIFHIVRELEAYERETELAQGRQQDPLPSAEAIATARLERVFAQDPIGRIRGAAAYFVDMDDRIVSMVLLLEGALVDANIELQSRKQQNASFQFASVHLESVKTSAVRAAHFLWRIQFPAIEQPWRSTYKDPGDKA